MSPAAERRVARRVPLAASAVLAHDATGREFPARCVDGSASGLMMYVPITAPLAAGQYVQVTLSKIDRPELEAIVPTPRRARIVRVDRSHLTQMGQVAVGLAFE